MKEKESDVRNFGFYWEILRPFKGYILSIISVGIIWAIFVSIKAYYLKLIIDYLPLSKTDPGILFWPVFIFLFGWFLNETCWRVRDWVIIYLKPYLKRHIVMICCKRLMKYDDHFYQKNTPPALIHGVRNIADGIEDSIFFVEEFFTHFIMVVSAIVSMLIVQTYFGILTAFWLIAWGFVASIWVKNGHLLSYAIFVLRTEFSSHLGDVFGNMQIIKTFNAQEHENNLTQEKASIVAAAEVKREKMFFGVWVIQGIAFLIILSAITYGLISGYSSGKVTVGDFSMLMDLSQTIYLHLFDIANDLSEMSESSGKMSQGLDLIYRQGRCDDNMQGKDTLKAKKGEIIFDHVNFLYPGSDPTDDPFFSNDYIKIEGGSTVALVGPSGGGKTTFVKLLLRLVEPQGGKILIDGQNISSCSVESVHSIFAMVPQELGLFNRSIRDNIAYGSFACSDEEIISAAKKAGAHDFIKNIPGQYEAILGSEIGLSGGQKQRLMIARGLLRKAKIFIFDESTSALDVRTEADVLQQIQEKTSGCTKIIIAHRLRTIQNADLILVCENGSIAEKGSHQELMEKNGLYAKLSALA